MPFFVKSLSIPELRRSNMLLTGTNQMGKSRLAMAIAETLQNQGLNENWRVICFDCVGHWKKLSSIPFFVQIKEPKKIKIPEHSIIFDISHLLPSQQKQFVEMALLDLWNSSLEKSRENWKLCIFEEAQLYARNTRSKVSEQLMRIASVGANHKIRCLFICPSLTGLETEIIRTTNQRAHFKLGRESNILKKFRSYYNLDWTKVALELDVGYFLYYLNGHLEIKHVNLFESETKPQQLHLKKPETKTEQNITQFKKNLGFWGKFALWYDPEEMNEAIKRRLERDQKQKRRVTKDFTKIEKEQDDLEESEDYILVELEEEENF